MERRQLIRNDFPSGTEGFDRDSVGAHLAAVAAHVAALEARIVALEVERETLRRQLDEARLVSAEVEPASPAPEPVYAARERVSSPEPSVPEVESGLVSVAKASGGEPVNAAEVTARLLASKLALEGADRETIRNRLADERDLDDADALVDNILKHLF